MAVVSNNNPPNFFATQPPPDPEPHNDRPKTAWNGEVKPDIQKGFDLMDTDHDKELSEEEFDAAIAANPDVFGPGVTFDQLDVDKDGVIKPQELSELGMAFGKLDIDQDGILSKEEATTPQNGYPPLMTPEQFDKLDKDGEEGVSFAELYNATNPDKNAEPYETNQSQ